jgi:hypothetical protein
MLTRVLLYDADDKVLKIQELTDSINLNLNRLQKQYQNKIFTIKFEIYKDYKWVTVGYIMVQDLAK